MFDKIVKLLNENELKMSMYYDPLKDLIKFLIHKDGSTYYRFDIDKGCALCEEDLEFIVLPEIKKAIQILKEKENPNGIPG